MPLKILFLSHKFYPDIGGIETTSETLAIAFSEAGHQVRVLTWSASEKENRFPFDIIRQPGTSALFQQHRWADIIFENNPAVQLAWPGIFFRRPSVVALHTWISKPNGEVGWKEKLKIQWLRHAKSVIAVSDALRKRIWPAAIVIGNAYKQDVFKRLTDVQKTLDFVFLGRLVSDKGADLAIQAFYKILSADTGKKYQLTIIGDGPELNSLKKMVSESEIENNVIFTGNLLGRELVDCLNKHRYLLVPSVWEEPFGIVALEGMACGCIPIVSDGGGLPDAVGDAGITFRRGDVNDLVKKIQDLMNNKELELQLLNLAESHLTAHQVDVVSQKYLEVIKAIAK